MICKKKFPSIWKKLRLGVVTTHINPLRTSFVLNCSIEMGRQIRHGLFILEPQANIKRSVKLHCNILLQGRIQDFFIRGWTRLLLYFNTNKPHSFSFLAEYRRSSQGGGRGGAHPLHPPPKSAPVLSTNYVGQAFPPTLSMNLATLVISWLLDSLSNSSNRMTCSCLPKGAFNPRGLNML